MGILKRAADLAFAFRFIRLLVLKWESWDAYTLGIIDERGKRDKSVKLDNDEKKSAYTPFIRMVANIKRLVGQNKFTSLASALYLIKEENNLTDNQVEKILERVDVDILLAEDNTWFLLDNHELAQGIYRLKENKHIGPSHEELVYAGDKVRVAEGSFPVGDVMGMNIYIAKHQKTSQQVFITAGEIYR